jgi:hypothetical protein
MELVFAAHTLAPHASTAASIDDRGQVRSSLLNGDDDFPPMHLFLGT